MKKYIIILCASALLLHAGKKERTLVRIADAVPGSVVHITGAHGDGTTGQKLYPNCADGYLDKAAARSLRRVQEGLQIMFPGRVLVTGGAYHPPQYSDGFAALYKEYNETHPDTPISAKFDEHVQGIVWMGTFVHKGADLSNPEDVAELKAKLPPLGYGEECRPGYAGEKLNHVQIYNRDLLAGLMAAAGWTQDPNSMWSRFVYTKVKHPQAFDQSFEALSLEHHATSGGATGEMGVIS